jgi:SAM-dependent methyltransferase
MKFCLTANKIFWDWEHLLISYQKHVTKNSIVLEIGASNKERTKDLSRYCKQLIGMDIFPERVFKDFANVRYVIGDWQRLSEFIAPQSIDVVISSHVIEHVSNDLKAINELYVVLKSGGIAILNTPNRKRLSRAVIEIFTGDRKFPYWEHVREYNYDDLLHLLNDSRFKKFQIIPVTFGIHGGPIYWYLEKPPIMFRKHTNFWEIHFFKESDPKLPQTLRG